MHKVLKFIFLISISTSIFARSLSEGYQYFLNNKISEAREQFSLAAIQPQLKAEAQLMLSILATIDKDKNTAFNHFIEFYKSSANPEPYILGLFHSKCVLGYEQMFSKHQLNWLTEVLKRPNLNSTLRACIYEDLAKYYELNHEIDKARKYFALIGTVNQWQITGTFDNISASGFEKNYAPIMHPEPDAVFKNAIGANVSWFDLYKYTPGRWIDFLNHFVCNNAIIYAQTFCNSSEQQMAYLRLGTSGSVKVWVNDCLIFEEEDERNNGIDTYVIPAKFEKGNNRILLQTGNSEINNNNFMLRVTDSTGNFIKNIEFSNVYTPYAKISQPLQKAMPDYVEAFFAKQIADNPDNIVNYLILAETYLTNDKTNDALNVLLKAQSIAPNCSYIQYQLTQLYLRDKNHTGYNITIEKLKQNDPDNPLALNAFINEALGRNNYSNAEIYINKKEKLYGNNVDLWLDKIQLAQEDNKHDNLVAFINKAYELYPSEYSIVIRKYQLEKTVLHNTLGAQQVLKKFVKKYFNKTAATSLASEYLANGNLADGIYTLEMLTNYIPSAENNYHFLANLYFEVGNNELSKAYYEACLKLAPFYGPYHGEYARVLERMGDKQGAIAEYIKNITFEPSDYNAIGKLRVLQEKKEIFSYFPVKDYYQLFKNSPDTAQYPSDNILSVTEETNTVVYESGAVEQQHVYLYKALTAAGIDYLKEYKISYQNNERLIIEKAQVLKKNGSTLKADVKDNEIVFTALEPGDGIILIYKTQRSVGGNLSSYFYETALLSTWYPSLNIEYNLLVPRKDQINTKLLNSTIEPIVSKCDDLFMYSWKKQYNKAILLEAYMPPMTETSDLLLLSNIPDWDYISKWYYDISHTKTKPGVEVIEQVNQLFKDKNYLSEIQKAKIIYNFIVNNIRYSSVPFRQNGIVPQKASDVLLTRIGDCKDVSVLFTSMCRVAGIKAGVVLVSRRQFGKNYLLLPNFEFDHAIARAELDGKEYFIELTSPYLAFSTLGQNLKKANVLRVTNDSTIKEAPICLNPATRLGNNVSRKTKVSFNNNSYTADIATVKTGEMAAYTRMYYSSLGKDEREKQFTQAISRDYASTKLNSLVFDDNIKNCSDSLTYHYNYTSNKVFSSIGNLSIIKLPLTDPMPQPEFISIEKREFPVESWNYAMEDTIDETIELQLPADKKLAEVPKNINIECNQAKYYLSFTLKGTSLLIKRRLININDNVEVAEYQNYKKFIEQVIAADEQQLGFK